MATWKKRPCIKCGESNRGKDDMCWRCKRDEQDRLSDKHCILCGVKITHHMKRGASGYCSLECAGAVTTAKGSVNSAINAAIKTGKVRPAKDFACVDCGKPAKDYEHRNYLRPLDVVPVCRSCNIKRGPADDVKELVAKYIGIAIEQLPAAMQKYRETWDRYRKKRMAWKHPAPILKPRQCRKCSCGRHVANSCASSSKTEYRASPISNGGSPQ